MTPEHRVGVVGDVGAVRRRAAVRHPPEPKKPENMVDSQPAAAAQHRPHHLAQRREAGLGQPVGPPRRQAPVLALLVETVRRCADAEAGRQLALQRPRIGAAGIDPDGKVVHDADAHAAFRRRLLRRVQLLGAAVLQPAVKRHPRGELATAPRRPRHRADPEAPRGQRRQSAPCRSASAHHSAKSSSARAVFGLRPRLDVSEKQLQRSGFRRPDLVAIDALAHRDAGAQARRRVPVPRGGGRVLGQQLGAQVQRRAEPPRGREVRRVLDRRDGSDGVQRVHQQQPGSLAAAPAGQLGEVGVIAHPPGAAHRIELRHPAPQPRGRQRQLVGRHDQRRRRPPPARRRTRSADGRRAAARPGSAAAARRARRRRRDRSPAREPGS